MTRQLAIIVTTVLLLTGCAQSGGPSSEMALTDAPKFGKFIWHDLITDDVAAARAFYGDLLGWTFEDSRRPGSRTPYTLIRSATGDYVGGIVALDDPDSGADYSRWLPYYAVPDVDAAAEASARSGGEVVVRPRDVGMVARVAAVRDPTNAVVGFISSNIGYPIDPLAPGTGDVAWNELVTSDPAAAAAFYAGLSHGAVREEPRGDQVYRMLRNEGRDRAGVMPRPNEDIEPLWLTYFAVRDPAASASRVAALGGEVLMAPSDSVRGGSIALVTDPTGAVLGLLRNP